MKYAQLTYCLLICLLAATSFAEDWPKWGRDISRNMVANEKNMPVDFNPGEVDFDTDMVDMKTTKNIKWVAKLGSQSYGNMTIADGRVYVGTNNNSPRDKRFKGDYCLVYCLSEEDGSLLWQFTAPKLGAGKVSDWEYLGMCSSPAIEGDRVYVVTNRCEVVCLDVNGMANGNDGEFQDEGQYFVGPGKPPVKPTETDADIIWRFDMSELGVFPHNITSSSALIFDDRIYVSTSNGVDWSHKNIANERAPALIALDKKTGELVGEEISGISSRTLHCNWSSPAAGIINGKKMIFFGAGDGFLYGYDAKPKVDDDLPYLNELFRYDLNKPSFRVDENGKPRAYASYKGPSECIATAVVYNNRVYIGIGQDPEHGDGVGLFSCVDPTKTGDITKTGKIWEADIDRTISTASIADGLVYVADYTGRLFCLDADTGKQYWMHDTQGHIWASTLVADGKVYLGNEDGYLLIMQAGKEKKLLNEIEFHAPIYSSAVAANGVLYVATQSHLYAIETGK